MAVPMLSRMQFEWCAFIPIVTKFSPSTAAITEILPQLLPQQVIRVVGLMNMPTAMSISLAPIFIGQLFGQPLRKKSASALEHLEQVIIFEGPATIGAILIESVVGTAGVLLPPAGYLEGVRALCDKYGIKWIADEVMAGFGRTGKWFAYQHSSAEPDLIVFAKGVNSGYVPLGGVIISDEIAKTFDERVFLADLPIVDIHLHALRLLQRST